MNTDFYESIIGMKMKDIIKLIKLPTKNTMLKLKQLNINPKKTFCRKDQKHSSYKHFTENEK